MKKHWAIVATLLVAAFGVRAFQNVRWRGLEADFRRPFFEARSVQIYRQQWNFPGQPQPQPQPIATMSGAQFAPIAAKIRLQPRRAPGYCAGLSDAITFRAIAGTAKPIANFNLEKQVECGNFIGDRSNASLSFNAKFADLELTPESHAAILEAVAALRVKTPRDKSRR